MPNDALLTTFLAAAFVVPGFIWSSVLSMLVPRRAGAGDLRAKEFLTFSCANYGLWSALLFVLFRSDFAARSPCLAAGLLFVIVFVSPIGLGLLSGALQQRNMVARLLARFGFRTVHPIPTAWDYQFSQGRPYWAMVTLRDGSAVCGLYGLRSFAGDAGGSRDLYLEVAYRISDDESWTRVVDSGGLWIASDNIALIEFRRIAEVEYD